MMKSKTEKKVYINDRIEKKHYENLKRQKKELNTGVFSNRTLFKCALISAFSKSIHLNYLHYLSNV